MTNNEITNAILAVEVAAPINSKWQHVKSGGAYAVTGYAMLEATTRPAICYAHTGPEQPIWARDAAEFLDGRFVQITDLTQ
jgi:hypothetical protein